MKIVIRWGPALFIMAAIFYLSHQPGGQLSTYLPYFQRLFPGMSSFNWGHFVAYFVLGCTFYWGLGPRWANLKGRLLVVGLCILYGITDEIHQIFIPERTADWIDVRNDAIGASLAMLLSSVPPLHRLYLKLLKFQ